MTQKKLVFLCIPILIFSFCSPKHEVKSEPQEEGVQEPTEPLPDQQILETVKIKKGPLISAKEAEAIQKINELLDRENVFENGIATWYGRRFHGRRTANGEKYDMYKLTAAHKTLPFHSLVEVENLDNGKRVIVRINDRGPFRNNRIIDLSYTAAKKLDCCKDGVVPVALRIIKPEEVTGAEMALLNNSQQKNEMPGKKAPEIKANEVIAKKKETKKAEVSQVSQVSNHAKFYLQAGAFSEKVNAQKMLENMKSNVADVTFDIYFQNGMYKVISAPQSSRAKAEELKKALQAFKIDAFIKEQI